MFHLVKIKIDNWPLLLFNDIEPTWVHGSSLSLFFLNFFWILFIEESQPSIIRWRLSSIRFYWWWKWLNTSVFIQFIQPIRRSPVITTWILQVSCPVVPVKKKYLNVCLNNENNPCHLINDGGWTIRVNVIT